MFGGATLVLFRNSPRLSKDLDLLARVHHLPSSEDLQNALEERVQEVAGIFGVGPVTFEPEQNGEQFYDCGSSDRRSKGFSRST
jgi:hypothetical protein